MISNARATQRAVDAHAGAQSPRTETSPWGRFEYRSVPRSAWIVVVAALSCAVFCRTWCLPPAGVDSGSSAAAAATLSTVKAADAAAADNSCFMQKSTADGVRCRRLNSREDAAVGGVSQQSAPHEKHQLALEAYIAFFLCSFLCAAALQWIISYITVYSIPVSIIWFLFGMFLDVVFVWRDINGGPTGGLLRRGVFYIGRMNAEVVYLVFLPILLYEACLDIDWHKFKMFAYSGISFAIVGVAYQVALVGFLVHATFSRVTQTQLSDAFLFASAMASTDPVAVISVLNTLQAPAKLASMFQGEALINDGSSMVLFQFFKSLSRGDVETWRAVVARLALLLLVSPIWGLLCGAVMYVWIRRYRRFSAMQVLALMSGGYCVYFVAEMYLHANGPIAIVCYGLYYIAFGHIALDYDTQQQHHHSVRALASLGTSSIFIIAGVVAARMIIEAVTARNSLDPSIIWNIPVLYIYLLLARGSMVVVLLPILKRTGYGITWKELVLLVWGGLRGAIVLAMGLTIEQDDRIPQATRYIAVLYIAGNTFLILLVNGVTFKLLFRFLNPYPPKPFRRVYLERVMRLIDRQYATEQKVLEEHWLFRGTGILEHANRAVPLLGWRRMDARGRIDFKLPSVSAAFSDLPKVIGWTLQPREEEKEPERLPPSEEQRRTGPISEGEGAVAAEQRAHDAAVAAFRLREPGEGGGSFDAESYLRLVESPGMTESEEATTVQPEHIVGITASQEPLSRGASGAAGQPLTRTISGSAREGSSFGRPFHRARRFQLPLRDPGGSSPRTAASEPLGSARMTRLRRPEWERRMLPFREMQRPPGAEEGAVHRQRSLPRSDLETGIYGLTRERHGAPRPTTERGEPMGQYWRPVYSDEQLRQTQRGVTIQSSDSYLFGGRPPRIEAAGRQRRREQPLTPSPPSRRRRFKRAPEPPSPARFPRRIVSEPSGELAKRRRRRALRDEEEYLNIPPPGEQPAVSLVRVLRKEREGELYIMAFNAIRQMYQRLYEQHFIGGAAMLSLNATLDLATDFAIGQLRRNPIKAWRDVLEKNAEEWTSEAEVTAASNITGFEFEWRALMCRLRCFGRRRPSWLVSRLRRYPWLETAVTYENAKTDLQLVAAFVDVHEELLWKGGQPLAELLGPELLTSYKRQLHDAKRFGAFLRRSYPQSFPYALAAHAATLLLNLKQMLVEEQAQKGLILQEDCERLLALFEEQRLNLESYRPFRWRWPWSRSSRGTNRGRWSTWGPHSSLTAGADVSDTDL